jgi:hypothetical protein
MQNAKHSWTSSKVQPINAQGDNVSWPRARPAAGSSGERIWSFNGTFPGSMINARYGQPVIVRFKNELVKGPIRPETFGRRRRRSLVHLHNGHTAPESDGNPHFRPDGYHPGELVDNLYMNWPPEGDDHREAVHPVVPRSLRGLTPARTSTGAGRLLPDLRRSRLTTRPHALGTSDDRPGDERRGCGCPACAGRATAPSRGLRHAARDSTTSCSTTVSRRTTISTTAAASGTVGRKFFKHYPNHGFVGDIFTVNGKAFPVLSVQQRRYRFRFLDASIARVYKFVLMNPRRRSGAAAARRAMAAPGRHAGHARSYRSPAKGGCCPNPLLRDSIELWPSAPQGSGARLQAVHRRADRDQEHVSLSRERHADG